MSATAPQYSQAKVALSPFSRSRGSVRDKCRYPIWPKAKQALEAWMSAIPRQGAWPRPALPGAPAMTMPAPSTASAAAMMDLRLNVRCTTSSLRQTQMGVTMVSRTTW